MSTDTQTTPREPDFATIARVLLIILAAVVAYSPSFTGGWLWDDDSEVTSHAALRTLGGLKAIWNGTSSVDYLPLKSTIQWVYYRFAGPDPGAWRVLNLAFHVLNCLLIWRLFSRLGIRLAWIGAFLFALHPLNVASVAWVSELKNTCSLPFLLLAMLAFLDYDTRRHAHDLARSVLLFALALLCKSSVAMFPLVILLYAWWRGAGGAGADPVSPAVRRWLDSLPSPGLRRGADILLETFPWRLVAAGIPFFLLSLFMGLLTIHFQYSRAIGGEYVPLGGWLSRFALSGTAVFFYLKQALLPYWLLPNYPRWPVDPPSVLQLLAWPALLAAFAFFWTRRRSWGRHAILGLGFFIINLLPILGFIRISFMRITWASDHFTYIPLIGILGLAASGCGLLYGRTPPGRRLALTCAGILVAASWLVGAHRYSRVYSGEESMWVYTLERNPDAWQAHNRLSGVLLRKGNLDAAFYHSAEALRLRPDIGETHNNYGGILIYQGDFQGALAEIEKACELSPNALPFRMNVANMYVRLQRYQEAAGLYRSLLAVTPNDPALLANYASSLFYLGQLDEGIAVLERVVAINPNLAFAQNNLARARALRESHATDLTLQPPGSGTASQGMELFDSREAPRLFNP